MSTPWFADSGGRDRRQPSRGGRSPYVPPPFHTQPNITVRGGVGVAPPPPPEISEKSDELDVGVTSKEEKSKEVEAEGVDIPPPATSFEEMRFSAKSLTDNIRRCKYVKPTPIQSHAIPAAMIGRDLMACAQTGSGKTAAFCFPIINAILMDKPRSKKPFPAGGSTAYPVALILAPTRELSCQVLHTHTPYSIDKYLHMSLFHLKSASLHSLQP